MSGLQPCGTVAAYKRHLYNQQEPCRACRTANHAYERARTDARHQRRLIEADIRQLVHVLAVAMGVGKEAA
jgi:hypothetical protein